MPLTIEEVVNSAVIIPVLVIEQLENAVPLAEALYSGGLKVLEITLRTAAALKAISAIKQAVPDAMVGAGTILTPADASLAVEAGSEFLVSPGSTPAIIDAALTSDIPIMPGVATPSEAMILLEQGFQFLKFFPAEAAGGVSMLHSIEGPLPQIKFCPTGGINRTNVATYLAAPNVVCAGGSWMAPKALIQQKAWDQIETLARDCAALKP